MLVSMARNLLGRFGLSVHRKESIYRLHRELGRLRRVVGANANSSELPSPIVSHISDKPQNHRDAEYDKVAVYRRLDTLQSSVRTSGFGFQAELTIDLLNAGRTFWEIMLKTTHKTASNAFTACNFLLVAHTLFKILRQRARNWLYHT
jgi:hypothetical protein